MNFILILFSHYFLCTSSWLTLLFLDGVAVGGAQKLPDLSSNLCNYDTIYDRIKTGNVVEYTLEVRYRYCPANRANKPCAISNTQGYAPGPILDGVQSQIIMINNTVPGPIIRAKLGDTIRVNIINNLGEPTTMHFHGMTQFRTPFMDGTDMITNCPIPTGYTHTYEFVAHPAGTTFYHSHTASQRVAGMTGALIIEDPADENVTDQVLFLQDWSHDNANANFEFWAQNWPGNCITFGGSYFTGVLNPGNDAIPQVPAVVGDGILFQSFIVNGNGMYDYNNTQIQYSLGNQSFQEMQCPGQNIDPPRCEYCLNTTDWTSFACSESSADSICGSPKIIAVAVNTTTRLRFIHGGYLFAAQVCIDGHTVDVVAADGSSVEPYTTDCFVIFSAERYDVIVAPQLPGDYWIRFTTLEQQTAAFFNTNASNVHQFQDGFPHFGYAILRVTDNGTGNKKTYLKSTDPLACDSSVTTNCGPKYWLSSKTLGCSISAAKSNPRRCVTSFDALKPSPTSNDDATICGNMLLPHQVNATIQATMALGFIPDQVPRWEGLGLNARIELLNESEWGFPYITPTNATVWGRHQPISFVNPDSPTLSLPPDVRKEIYDRRMTFETPLPNNTDLNTTFYPKDYPTGVLGTNAIMAKYGDVIRIYFSCSAPYGPGCAMPHPMHLHGHRMAILYVGGANETYEEARLNINNPLYRDTVTVHTDSFVVVQVAATNPGVWRWHCHVDIHHRGGMAILLDVGGDSSVEAIRATPDSVNLCPLTGSSYNGNDKNNSNDNSSGSSPLNWLAKTVQILIFATSVALFH